MKTIAGVQRIHMVGIKGSGMMALAQLLLNAGKMVTGSDTDEVFFNDQVLATIGITPRTFSSENITPNIELVIHSTAYPLSHPELVRAEELGIARMTYPEALAEIFNASYGIAVCGSHGKTTTSALLGTTMVKLGMDPTVLVGSQVVEWGVNSRAGKAEYFVIEADEYQNKLAHYLPKIALLTNVDYDHPDFFTTRESYDLVFADFIKKVTAAGGYVVACIDDDGVRRVLEGQDMARVITYGFDDDAMMRITEYVPSSEGIGLACVYQGKEYRVVVPLAGRHSARNAAGVLTVLSLLGCEDVSSLAAAIARFEGTARRFARKGVLAGGCTVWIDDFAHHPTEIMTTLAGVRELYPEARIACVFGPHTFSRTEALMDEFARSFDAVDEVVVTEIFASAREQGGVVSSRDLATKIAQYGVRVHYATTNEEAIAYLVPHLSEIDVLVTMGAGEVWRVGEGLL